jgi:hypothetical protein
VEAEIAGKAIERPSNGKASPRRIEAPGGKASNKQIKYILDLGKAREKRLADLNAEAERLYGVESIYELTKPDASRFVDVLKAA